ncbi:MAG: TIGR02444 family protein [bacterium]|nr:TIGR02444 family protein [bacterium]
MTLWDWALKAYARQDVADACLNLQDGHGQNVPYLLWAAWAAGEGRTVDPKVAALLMRRWDAEIGAPLRGVRRALKPTSPDIADQAREDLREAVKAVELRSERVLLESLEALTGPAAAPRDVLESLVEAAAASGDPPRRSALERLAGALS